MTSKPLEPDWIAAEYGGGSESGPEWCYLLCFSIPLINGNGKRKVQHRIGWASDTTHLHARIVQHQHGLGSPMAAAVIERGGRVTVARLWEAPRGEGRKLERRLKNIHGGRWQHCPHHASA